jgi:DNA polymerase III delta subunit
MLYVFHGTDISKSLEKARHLIDSLRAKKPDASYVPINADNWHASIVEEHLGGQGLFSNKYIVFLDRVTENDEAKEAISGFVQAMNESTNIFVTLEGKLNAELKKVFEKHAEKVVVTDLPAVGKSFGAKGDFNVFALADAVGNRDRARSWAIYRQAIDQGLESESILGTLFWQMKSMIVANEGKSAAETGLSPFVFSKSKKYSSNYSVSELKTFLTRLITLYHDGHRGMVDLELATEKLLLEL